MKGPFVLLIALVLFCAPAILFAQDNDTNDTTGFVGFKAPPKAAFKSNVIKTSPVPILVAGQIPLCGELRITYERVLNAHHSIIIGASYNYPSLLMLATSAMDTSSTKITDFSFRGGRIMLGYRYYLLKHRKKEAPHGLYVGPYLSYNFVKIKEKGGNGSSETLHYFNASGIFGYQIVAKNGFSFEFFTGLGYRDNFITDYDARTNRTTQSSFSLIKIPDEPGFIKHVKFILQVNFGYAF